MGKCYETLDPDLQVWLAKQKIFFIATAPLGLEGHINCSPKGVDTFRVLGEREVAYLDLTGSGIETIAHLQENGRIVILFCAFEGSPKIVRLHGEGEVVYPADPQFAELIRHFPASPGTRAIIRVNLTRISDSCGYAVPVFDYVRARDTLERWCDRKGEDELAAYRAEKNAESIDGLPGYKSC